MHGLAFRMIAASRRYNPPMRSTALAAALIITTVVLLPASRQTTALPIRGLETLFADLHARGLFDGAVVAGNDEVVFARGYGEANVARHVPFTPDTPSDGASLAKTLTAAVLLHLAAEGTVDLDAQAQRLLPELPYPDITLRHLLSHSSGIPVSDYDYFDPYIPKGEVRTTEMLLRVLASRKPPLASAPGTAFEYSSFGYDLAALAAARAAGTSYADLVRERVFRPLGMASAFVRPARLDEFPVPRTLGYRRAGGRLELNDVFDLEGFHGGSNVYISAKDLHRWNLSFLRRPLLPPAALTRALEPAKVGNGISGLTLGSWYRSADRGAFWYSGHLQGFHSEVFRNVRSGISIVYVSNNTLEPWLQKGIVRAVVTVLEQGTVPPVVAPATDPVSSKEHASLAGRWMLPHGGDVVIARSGDTICIEREGVRYRIVQITPRAFYVPGLDFVLGFARGTEGTLSRIRVESNVDEQWGSRRP